jgi:hypothetical protein
MVYMGYYGKISDPFQHRFLNYKRKVGLSRCRKGWGG